MICEACKIDAHASCEDWDPVQANKEKPKYVIKPGRLYRSCDCLHRNRLKPEPATGPAGE